MTLALSLFSMQTMAQDSPDPSPELGEQLAQLLSEDPERHELALDRIVAMGDAVVDDLERVAADASYHPRQRAGAVFALGRIGAERSQGFLEELWASGLDALGSGLAIQVAIALAEYGELRPLREMLAAGDEILAAKAAVQLGLRGDAESLPGLEEAYESERYARMRPFFAIALGLLGDDRGEALLRSGLRTLELRNHCAVALARLGFGEDVRFELEFALADSDPLVRLGALDGLAALDVSNLDDLLSALREDPDRRVRERAEALSRTRARGRGARDARKPG